LTIALEGEQHTRVRLDRRTRGWIRRLAPPRWRTPVTSGSEAWAIRSAWTSLLIAIAADPKVRWLTPLERLFFAENKLLQIRAAREIGISVPATAVSAASSDIPEALGSPLVVKPLGPSHFSDEVGAEQVLWSQPLERSAPELAHLSGAPFILQEHIRADRHLRVVTVRSRAWICSLDAAGLPLDWRRSEAGHSAFEVADEPKLAEASKQIAAALSVGYSSQDWILSDGRFHFIELNPAGQWLFLPEPVASEVTAEIAAWLIG
jgi:glutathione synthase/RimK-type ligase-like ATP-grasp enzyme